MNRSMSGFTLVEMLIVLGIFGLMLALAIPAIGRLGQTHNLKGARDDVSAQIRMARARAIASGDSIQVHFYPGAMPAFDYHIHQNLVPTMGWNLPRGVTFAQTNLGVTMLNNGRARQSLVLPLVDRYGHADTITVLTSGMVVAK